MSSFLSLFRKLSVFTAMLMAVLPVLRSGSAASLDTGSREVILHQPVALAATWVQPQSDDDTLQLALNLVVRHSLTAAEWEVSSVDGQINEESLRESANGLIGISKWRVEVLDEKRQSLALEGNLTFSVDSGIQSSQGFSVVSGLSDLTDAMVSIKGELRGTGIEVVLEVTSSLVRQGDTLNWKGSRP